MFSLYLQTYFNIDILTLVRNLVTGCVDPDLDIILSQGRQPDGTQETPEIQQARNRCRVEQLSLNDDSFKQLGVSELIYLVIYLITRI